MLTFLFTDPVLIATLLQTEKILKDEFEALGTAWVKLEEQVADKVFNLSEREDQISKLVGEVSKVLEIGID